MTSAKSASDLSATSRAQQRLLERWKAAVGGTDAEARRLLGISKAAWSRYINGVAVVPWYIECSVEAHLALMEGNAKAFAALVGKRDGKRAAP